MVNASVEQLSTPQCTYAWYVRIYVFPQAHRGVLTTVQL
jgi:hypothetical protein